MLTIQDIYNTQSKYGVGNVIEDKDAVPYSQYVVSCRKFLSDRIKNEYYTWDRRKQQNYNENLIRTFVQKANRLVEGFIDNNGDLMQDELLDRLRQDIIDYGVLKAAFEDERVQEIQVNDYKTIYVVKGGKAVLFTDERTGKPYQFVSNEELQSLVNRIIYTPGGNAPRMTVTNPLMNTRTAAKGYRLSAVNDSAITRDMTEGFDFPVTSVTIRKYSTSRLTFTDFEKFGSLVPRMSRFLRLCGRVDTRLCCVGPTSSGKTTLLNALVWEIPRDTRIILVQNPTEIMLYDRDPVTGANRRNVIHWEAQDIEESKKNDPSTPTMANFIAHALRNTPDIIIPGEMRTPEEFNQANRALKTGHRVLTTFHAEDSVDAISRFATELATVGGDVTDHMRSVANSIDLIVCQKKLDNGQRKVMEISELTGALDKETGMPEVNTVFQFVPVTSDDGQIGGYFEQVNPISSALHRKFNLSGIEAWRLEEFLNPPARIPGRSNLPANDPEPQPPAKEE